jgi:exodeoxyribonuclease X
MTGAPMALQPIATARVCGAVSTPISYGGPEIIEFASRDLYLSGNTVVRCSDVRSSFFAPTTALPPPEEIAGICGCDFSPQEPWDDNLKDFVSTPAVPRFFVAHGASHLSMLLPDPPKINMGWICTKKLAMHFWPNAPGYHLQTLFAWRPWSDNQHIAVLAHQSERAATVALLTASLLTHLLKLLPPQQLVHLSTWVVQPTSPPPGPFDRTGWSFLPIEDVRFYASHFNKLPAFVKRRAQMEIVRREKQAMHLRQIQCLLPVE